MKKVSALLLSVLMMISAASCAPKTATNTSSTTSQKATEETVYYAENNSIKAVLKELGEKNFSGIIYAVRHGEPIATYAKGKLYKDVPITLKTPMPVGSVSKQFCAAAIMLLQEKGKLKVTDKLVKYFPEYKNAKEVTLHDMLCMRSGIPNLDASVPLDIISMDNTDEENTKALFSWLFKQPLNFRPTSMYEYSNCNYLLLANIIEKVTGQKYTDFLRENIFKPLGMNNTGSIFELRDKPAWAKAFSYEASELSPGIEPGVAKGAGDIITTAEDITKWLDALPSGKIISKESYEAMTTDYTKSADRYGYGLALEKHDGTGHGGTIGHFNSYDLMINDYKITVFIASNESGSSTLENQLDNLIPALYKYNER